MKPVLLYDGDCGFCRRWVGRWKGRLGDQVQFLPYQERGERFPSLSDEALRRSVHLAEPSGRILIGAEAVLTLISRLPAWGWLLWCYCHLPGIAIVSESTYRFIARHRHRHQMGRSAQKCTLK